MRRAALLALLLLTSSCKVLEQPNGLIARYTTAYKQVISDDDRVRLRDWRKSFEDALAEARTSGHASEITREGALLDPDAALPGPAIPNGMYRCRVIKLGSKTTGSPSFLVTPSVNCRVKADRQLQRLGKLGGPQRYVGVIFAGNAIRNVFLGTLVFADETRALQYGQDRQRDVAAHVERIGEKRWRLVMPQPHFESRLDVLELVPS